MSQYVPCVTIRFPPMLLLLLLVSLPVQAKRHDIIVMKNGDHITGEVQKLEHGVLYIEPEYVSEAYGVDWFQVASIQSAAAFQVVLKNGDRSAGKIERVAPDYAPGADFKVHAEGQEVTTPAADVVEIKSENKNFFHQLTGSIDFGYNFTSGNSQTSLSTGANASYLSTKWTGGGSITSSYSGQSGGSTTNLQETTVNAGRFLSSNSTLVGVTDFLHSSQQSLDLRTTLGLGYGHYWIRSNRAILSTIFGLAYNHEKFTSTSASPTQQNVEGLLGIQYQRFYFSRYQLLTQFFAFPGLSDTGRILATTKTTFSVKLVNNFHTDFSFWDNFDSRPPISAKKNELGISESLGWTF